MANTRAAREDPAALSHAEPSEPRAARVGAGGRLHQQDPRRGFGLLTPAVSEVPRHARDFHRQAAVSVLPAHSGEAGVMPDTIKKQIADTLWSLMEGRSQLTTLVLAGNRLKQTEQRGWLKERMIRPANNFPQIELDNGRET